MRRPIQLTARFALTGLVAASLTACGSGSEQPATNASQAADQLESAAAQSDPEAATVMTERADELRGSGSSAALDDPNGAVQETMREAGAAQSGTAGQ